ncbi:MAG: hypothetical protein ACK5HP_03215 [Bacilli bacterium]
MKDYYKSDFNGFYPYCGVEKNNCDIKNIVNNLVSKSINIYNYLKEISSLEQSKTTNFQYNNIILEELNNLIVDEATYIRQLELDNNQYFINIIDSLENLLDTSKIISFTSNQNSKIDILFKEFSSIHENIIEDGTYAVNSSNYIINRIIKELYQEVGEYSLQDDFTYFLLKEIDNELSLDKYFNLNKNLIELKFRLLLSNKTICDMYINSKVLEINTNISNQFSKTTLAHNIEQENDRIKFFLETMSEILSFNNKFIGDVQKQFYYQKRLKYSKMILNPELIEQLYIGQQEEYKFKNKILKKVIQNMEEKYD